MTTEQEDKIIQQAQDIIEKRTGVREDIKINLQNLLHYSAYYQGARRGLMEMLRYIEHPPKGEERVYEKALFDLYTASIRNTQLFLDGTEVRFRNWQKDKKGKLTKCEAYFVDRITIVREKT